MIAEASASVLGRATVCAIAKSAPDGSRPGRTPAPAREVAMLIGHIDRLTDKAARMPADEKDLS